jgi:hypothetical protein
MKNLVWLDGTQVTKQFKHNKDVVLIFLNTLMMVKLQGGVTGVMVQYTWGVWFSYY